MKKKQKYEYMWSLKKPMYIDKTDKMVNMSMDEIEAFILSIGNYGWEAGYTQLMTSYTVADLMNAIGTNNSALQVLNAQGEEKKKAQRDIITQLLVALVAMLKSAVG